MSEYEALIRVMLAAVLGGVTTAAGIWAVTGIGIAAGLGSYVLAIGATVMLLIILYLLKLFERLLGTR